MNKTIRSGIDVEVALTSSAKRMAAIPGLPSRQAAVIASTFSGQSLSSTPETYSTGSKMLGKIKVSLRPAVRAMYRVSKPVWRPIALRVRAFFLAGLPQGPQLELSAILAELSTIKKELLDQRKSVQLLADIVDSEVLATHAELTAVHQELLDQRDSLQIHINPIDSKVLAIITELTAITNQLHDQRDLRQADTHRLDRIEQYAFASARRVAVNCGPGEVLVRTEVGYILCAPSDHAVLTSLLEAGELERGTRLLIQSFLKPKSVFVDVGANLGIHTLAAARAMQGQGRIIAFEPFEPTQRLLARSVWINGFSPIVEIHQAAVSNKTGLQALFLGATSGHHSLFEVPSPCGLAPQPVEVPLVRLDDVIQSNTPVDLIKIDVEGVELDVLKSAKSLISNNVSIALIVEFGFSHLSRIGHTTEDWLAAFHELGLIYQAINADTGKLEVWTAAQLEAVDSVNLFFARPESIAWARARAVP